MNIVKFWLEDEGLCLISGWAREGLSLAEIADKIGIKCQTLAMWIQRYPKIRERVYSSRQVTDAKVEEAILKKALGFETTEIRQVKKANGEEEQTCVTKSVPPDISACTIWLKNSCPEKWGDGKANDFGRIQEILSRLDSEGEECED